MPVTNVEYLAFAWPLISYARRKLDAYASHSNFRWSIHKSQFCLVWVCFLFCFLCMHCGRRSPLAGSAIYCSTNKKKTTTKSIDRIHRVQVNKSSGEWFDGVHRMKVSSSRFECARRRTHAVRRKKKISRMFSVCVITACVMRAKRKNYSHIALANIRIC